MDIYAVGEIFTVSLLPDQRAKRSERNDLSY